MVAEFTKIVEYFQNEQALKRVETANKSMGPRTFWEGVGWIKDTLL